MNGLPPKYWKKAPPPRAMRAVRGNALETVQLRSYFGCTEDLLKVLSSQRIQATRPMLSDPTEIPPPHRETGVTIPLSHCFSVVSQTIAATPPLLSIKLAYRSPKTGLGGGGIAGKLAFEAYRAIGGIA